MTWQLIGSATSLSELQKAIEERFYFSKIGLIQITETHWKVTNEIGDKQHEGVRIERKGKRYRFEMKKGE